MVPRCLLVLGCLLSAFAACPVYAQTPVGGVSLDQFEPVPAGDWFVSTSSPRTQGHLLPRGVLVFDYAHRPLVVSVDDGAGASTSGAVVGGQGFVHVGASLALWDRLLVAATFPIAILQRGESPTLGDTTFASPQGVAAGDLRLSARVKLWGEDDDILQMATGMSVYAPTGPAGAFTSDGGVRLAPELVLGGQAPRFVWSVMVRPTFRSSENPATLAYGAAASVSLLQDRLRIGPEFLASSPMQDGLIRLRENKTIQRGLKTNAEIWLGVRGRVLSGLWLGAAGGPGLSDAIGTPAFRVMGSLAWSPDPAKKPKAAPVAIDTDDDGLLDAVDGCPYTFGAKDPDPKRNGCPLIDTDEDGVQDADDVCPEEPGARGANEKRVGCPADRDEDGVADGVDVCPEAKGEPAKNGC